jgi:chromosome segregation ATPase
MRTPTEIQTIPNNAQMITLKAEIVELRSQLAQAHAENIDDSATLHSMTEIDDLKNKLRRRETELKMLRQKNQEILQDRQVLMESEREWKKRLDALKVSSQETQARLEENLLNAMKSTDDVRSQFIQTRANLLCLERERARGQMNSSENVDRINEQLVKARKERDQLKLELSKAHNFAKAEREELTKQLADLREKYLHTNQEPLTGIREQQRRQDEVTRHHSELQDLKRILSVKDQELALKTWKIAQMTEELRILKSKFVGGDEAIANLFRELETIKAMGSSVSRELNLYKSLLDDARIHAKQPENQDFLIHLDDKFMDRLRQNLHNVQVTMPHIENQYVASALKGEIRQLRKTVSESCRKKEVTAPYETEVRLAAIEQPLLNEVSLLKAKVAESQTKANEESYKMQTERQDSKEIQNKHLADIERLQKEKDEANAAKNILEAQVIELRTKSSGVLSKDVDAANVDITEVSHNINRLGRKLAQARKQTTSRKNSWASLDDVTKCRSRQEDPGMDHSIATAPVVRVSSAPGSTAQEVVNPGKFKVEHTSATAARSSKHLSLGQLTRELAASKKRLQTADRRLNGLVNEGLLHTVLRRNPVDSTFDGSIDELVEENDGCIEVNHRRFADV